MKNDSQEKRIDYAERVISATPQIIFNTFLDPKAFVSFLPPKGMKGHIYEFETQPGGSYHISLSYLGTDESIQGKTSKFEDVVKGKFVEIIPNERIIQLVEFESEDPVFQGEMLMTWTFLEVLEGTKVTIMCVNVPEGIRKEDHDKGLASTLENLAEYIASSI